jgi:hypothetical protein
VVNNGEKMKWGRWMAPQMELTLPFDFLNRCVQKTVGSVGNGILVTEPSQNPHSVKMEFRNSVLFGAWQVVVITSLLELWADCERHYSDLLFPGNPMYQYLDAGFRIKFLFVLLS